MPEMIPRELLPLMDMIVTNHPELWKKIEQHSKDWIDIMATVCAEVGIVMDGQYSKADLMVLETHLVRRLKSQSSSIILPFN